MRIKKKIGIGVGIIILSFVVLIIITQIWWASLTPEERLQIEEKRIAKELQEKIDSEQRALQQKIDDEQEEKSKELIELSKKEQAEREEAAALEKEKANALQQQKEDAKLSTKDLQKIIAGFESYNKSVKLLLDMCVDVESENDLRQLVQLIDEHGDNFLDTTSGYGAVRNTLMSEGYGDHPVLGPLMDQSEILVDQMSTCMEVLALEFGG